VTEPLFLRAIGSSQNMPYGGRLHDTPVAPRVSINRLREGYALGLLGRSAQA